MSMGKIVVELELKDGNFSGRILRNGKAIRDFTRILQGTSAGLDTMDRKTTRLLPKLRDLTTVVGLGASAFHNIKAATFDWMASIVQTNAELERLRMLLAGMSSGTETERFRKSGEDFQFLIESVKSAPFALNEVANTFVKFKSVGLDPTDGSMRSLLDAIAQFGGTDQVLHRATVAIQQMAGKGVISMEELRQQLGEAIPNAIPLMAEALNMSVGDMVENISKGAIESDEALRRLFDRFEMHMGGASERMMTTVTGMLARLRTEWTLFIQKIGNSEYFDRVKVNLEKMIDYFQDGSMDLWAERIGRALAAFVDGLVAVIKFANDYATALKSVIKFGLMAFAAFKVRNLIVSLATFTTGLIATGNAAAGAALHLNNFAFKSNLVAIRAGIAARATTGMAGAMTALGGPVGVAVSLIATVGMAFLSMSSEAEEAMDRIKESISGISDEQLQLIDQRILEMQTRLTNLRSQDPGRVRGGPEAQLRAKELHNQRIVDLEKELNDVLLRTEEAREENSRTSNERQRRAAERYFRDRIADLKSAWSKTNAAIVLEKRNSGGDMSNDTFANLLKDNDLELFKGKAEALKGLIRDANRDMHTLSGRQAEEAGARLKAFRDLAQDVDRAIIDASARETYVVNDTKADDAAAKAAADRLISLHDKLRAKLAGSRAELGNVNDELAEFNQMLLDGKFGKAKIIDQKMVQDIRSMIPELSTLEDRVKSLKEARERLATVTLNTARADGILIEKIQDLNVELAGGDSIRSNAARKFEVLRDELWSLAEVAGITSGEIIAALDAIDAAAAKQSRADSLKSATEYKEETDSIISGFGRQREAIIATHELKMGVAREALQAARADAETNKELISELTRYMIAETEKLRLDLRSPMELLNEEWQDITKQMGDTWANWAKEATEALVDFVETGKFSFSSLVSSIIKDLLRLAIQKAVTGPIFQALSGAFTSGAGSSSSSYASAGNPHIEKYADGGIANRPQLAVFGEGSMAEAFVPLPDGKTIPVSMNKSSAAEVSVNVINQSGQDVHAEERGRRVDGSKMVLDVVLTAMNKPGAFRDSMKSAVRK